MFDKHLKPLILSSYLISEYPSISTVSSTPFEKSAEVATNWQLSDTLIKITFSNDNYLNYNFNKGFYKIEWGNEKFKNHSNQEFEIQGNGNLKLLDYDPKTILLSQGCGTSCSYYVVLQISDKVNEKIYHFTKAYDLKNNLVAFIPENTSGLRIRVENYKTGQYQDIIEDNYCSAAFTGDCIDSCYFENESLILKWQGSDWKNDSSDMQELKVKISL